MQSFDVIQFACKAARLVAKGKRIEVRVGTLQSDPLGEQMPVANALLWADDADIGYAELDELDLRDLTPDARGIIKLDLLLTKRNGDSIDEEVFIDTNRQAAFFDLELLRPIGDVLKKIPRLSTRQQAILDYGEQPVLEAERHATDSLRCVLSQARLAAHGYVVPRSIHPAMTLDWSKSRTRSRGGATGISIAMRRSFNAGRNQTYREYASYAQDPIIGSVPDASPVARIALAIAHELAHWIQCNSRIKRPDARSRYTAIHGVGFQDIYAILRQTPHMQALIG